MDPLGTATEAVSILYEVIKFYRGYRGIPKDIDNSLDRSLRSSQYLKMWMDVFQRLDQNSVPENFSTNLSMTLKRLKLALDAHRREMVEWMVEMGFPEPTIGDESTANHSRPSSFLQTKRSSMLKAPVLKSLFVLMGAGTLKSLEKKIKESESEVMNIYLTIVPFAIFKPFHPNSDSSIEPPIVDFLTAAKKRQSDTVAVNIITEEEWINSYDKEKSVVDENMSRARQILIYTIRPKSDNPAAAESTKLRHFGRFICYSRSGDSDEVESMDLARLFAVDEGNTSSSNQIGVFRGDGDMLRCSAVIKSKLYLQYIFKVPQGSTGIRTLRSLLLDKGACPDGQNTPLHPIADRVKFSIRLATSVLVVHSLGLVHKRIHPESILVIDTDGSAEFPNTLGYPYLVGFHLSRSEGGRTSYLQDVQELVKRGIYFHPREQAAERFEPYFMISDIYSLGVCLLEIAIWRSLFIADDAKKDYVLDNTSGFEKLVDGYYPKEMLWADKAKSKMAELIRIAKAEIPRTMGNTFADVVVACLRAGDQDSPFADLGELKGGGDTVSGSDARTYKYASVKYLELVLRNLQAVYDGLSGSH